MRNAEEEMMGLPGEVGLGPMGPMEPMGPMGGSGHSVPLDALAMPDDTEQMTPPDVGDLVTYTVEGKVVSIDGGNAQVEPESINGVPMNAGQPAGLEPPDEFGGLEEEALGRGML